jgi:hypothetical protein
MARPGLLNHRKFRRFASAIGDDALALGSLELIWASAYEAGDDYLGDTTDVEIAARWKGERGALVTALLGAGGNGSIGFIERIEGRETYRVHDLWHHAPEYVRKRRKRESERRERDDPVRSVSRQCPDSVRTTADDGTQVPVTQPREGLTPAPAPAPAPALKDQDQERVGASEKPDAPARTKRRFVTPTVEEVKTYCKERGNGIDPQLFIDKNTAIGWVVGKNRTPMKDWKAAIRTWEAREPKAQEQFTEKEKHCHIPGCTAKQLSQTSFTWHCRKHDPVFGDITGEKQKAT